MKLKPLASPHRPWFFIFGLWILFLSGILADLFRSPPGMIQAFRLTSLSAERIEKLRETEALNRKLLAEVSQLEVNSYIQESEIRRVLGYATSDELIFDFSTENQD